jgi:hypothetical protein
MLKDVKIPGILWTVLIAAAIIFCENYLPPEYAAYGPIAVVVLMGAAKAANLGTKEIEELLAILRGIKGNQVRAMHNPEEMAAAPTITVPETTIEKYEPNKAVRFLLG